MGSAKTSKRAALKRIGIPRSTYYRWVNTLRKTGTLQSCVRKSDYCCITKRDDIKKMVFQVMHAPPSDFGFNRTTWKLDELQEAIAKSGIQVGRHSIRRIVKDAGYRWLKAREGFFSIDEYGPFSVKKTAWKEAYSTRGNLYSTTISKIERCTDNDGGFGTFDKPSYPLLF